LCGTFEVCIREYLRCLFVLKPISMFEYISHEDKKGSVSLREIISAGSHSELISILSERASGIASKGKYGVVFSRALVLSGIHGKITFSDALNDIQNRRNKIIHERHRPNTKLEDVATVHEVVDEAIQKLGEIGVKIELPGKYTCVNSRHFVITNVIGLTKDEI